MISLARFGSNTFLQYFACCQVVIQVRCALMAAFLEAMANDEEAGQDSCDANLG